MTNYGNKESRPILLYAVNVDWYFLLHWVDRALAARDAGFDVRIATNISSTENEKKLVRYGFDVFHVPFVRSTMNPFRDLYGVWRLWVALRKMRPALAHCITIKPVIYGGFLSRWMGVPCVASIVGLGVAFPANSMTARTARWILSRAVAAALKSSSTRVMFENSHDRDVLAKRSGVAVERAIIVPGAGVDLERFKYSSEMTDGTFRILFASRLLKSKGLEMLVTATGCLRAAGIDAVLHVAGIEDADSKDPIPLSIIEAWDVEGKLVWHGNVENVERLIASSSVVCLPTTYGEGIPRILIEAAACGRPVVSTLVPGCKEFVVANIDGLLVPPEDIVALTAALKELAVDSGKRVRMGIAGRKKVEFQYSNAVVVERTLRCYRDLLGATAIARSRRTNAR
jgi:glycosyltransferase involved in cell wall biosynthesis